ncbi:hypothetical protein FRB97_007104 [Tulasnella sp. 331]|nr:hypothetical protein FRB97_007104 [Tulasnella sp. 331]KAG8888473.1 hypothetical protein FRB98_007602 [Tulasnella sp. 332]
MPPNVRPILASKSTLTRSPLTRDFRHALAPTKLRAYAPAAYLRNPYKGVPVSERIKHWNIVPGDKVRIIGGAFQDKEVVRQVDAVDKLMNRVYIKGLTGKGGKKAKSNLQWAHYSNLQLLVGKYEFVPKDGDTPVKQNVWATRLSTSKPFYIKKHGVWVWNRYAAATIPALPTPPLEEGNALIPARKNRISIPWPKGPKVEKAKPGPYDTRPEDALEITWAPHHPGVAVDYSTLEHLYIRSLHPSASFFNPTPRSITATDSESSPTSFLQNQAPMEHYLAAELSNPHSRAKKQKRWQEKQATEAALQQDILKQELERAKRTGPGAELGGRRIKPSEAKRIAEWKWKTELNKRSTQEKYKRWVARGGLENKKRRQVRSARKLRRAHERLRNLQLGEEKNQVVPSIASPSSQK